MKGILLKVRRAYAKVWFMLRWKDCVVSCANHMTMQLRMVDMDTIGFGVNLIAPIPKWLGGGCVNAKVQSYTRGAFISDGGKLYFTSIKYADSKNGVYE